MASLKVVMVNAATRQPLLFNSVVGYGVFAGGDAMAQRLENGATGVWDRRRSLSIGFLGVLQNGILLRLWYRALDRFVTPKTDLRSVAKKIACDEAIFAPQLAFTYLASSAFIQEPGDWEGVRANVNDKIFDTWKNDLKLWPMANLFGFSFVPRAIRPMYASGVQLAWQCYLSTVGFKRPLPPAEMEADFAQA